MFHSSRFPRSIFSISGSLHFTAGITRDVTDSRYVPWYSLPGKTWKICNFYEISFLQEFSWNFIDTQRSFWNFTFKLKFCLFLEKLFLWLFFLDNAKRRLAISVAYTSAYILMWLASFYKEIKNGKKKVKDTIHSRKEFTEL